MNRARKRLEQFKALVRETCKRIVTAESTGAAAVHAFTLLLTPAVFVALVVFGVAE